MRGPLDRQGLQGWAQTLHTFWDDGPGRSLRLFEPDQLDLPKPARVARGWKRAAVLIALRGPAGRERGSLAWLERPREALGGRTPFECCGPFSSFCHALALAQLEADGDLPDDDPRLELAGEARDLAAWVLDEANAHDPFTRAVRGLAAVLGGTAQAVLAFACHALPREFAGSDGGQPTMLRLGLARRWIDVEAAMRSLGYVGDPIDPEGVR